MERMLSAQTQQIMAQEETNRHLRRLVEAS